MNFPSLPHLPLQYNPEYYMKLAVEQAFQAAALEEVPVGACLVFPVTLKNKTEQIILGHNQPITTHDATAHAEMQVLRQGGKLQQNYRLNEAILFVTLEPCVMCFGAIINARIKHVYFATSEPKKGVYHSCLNLFHHQLLNPKGNTSVSYGLLQYESQQLLQKFFQERRQRRQSDNHHL